MTDAEKQKREALIGNALRIADLWFAPWGAAKGEELKALGVDCLNPERAIERIGELLREAAR